MNKEESFQVYSSILKEAAALLDDRRKYIDAEARKPESQGPQDVLFNTFRTRSIKVYSGHLNFAANEILSPDQAVAVYRLPTLRTVMDIYARFLYVHDSSINENDKFLRLLSYQLLAFRKSADHKDFENIIAIYSDHLDQIKPDYPRTWKQFSYDWLDDQNLLFPPSKKYLDSEKMKRYSPKAAGVFGSENQYIIYKHLSELIHGNPFMAYGVGRERYWIAAATLGNAAYFLELIDNQVFKNDKRRDFRNWLKNVSDNKHHLLEHWQRERDPNEEISEIS